MKISFDSPGSDRGGNTSINAEYIDIRNNTIRTVRMAPHSGRRHRPQSSQKGQIKAPLDRPLDQDAKP
ncbi:hypothetical protein ACTMTF_47720 [Nonomuraea sp. ZG12]|uniref:hypothetical protein n=1 Tax=Nonomuraea sp. ZG12 TaxID=3452207 RepID=UPI003F8AADCC